MLGLTALAMLPFGVVVFYSAVLGALLVVLPQAYFAWRVFRFRGAQFSQSVLKSFYVGEMVKLLMTSAGFAIVFAGVHPLNAGVFMGMFLAGQLLFWFAPLFLKPKSFKTYKMVAAKSERSVVAR